MKPFKFIDLFSGIGGFHLAMTALGGECVFASDIDADCRKTYKANYGLEPAGDITKIAAEDIPEHDVLCGGFPCQAFSKAGKRLGFSDPTKGTLFFDIKRIAEYHNPKYILLENVRNLASHDKGNTWRVIRDTLKTICTSEEAVAAGKIGYNVIDEPVIFSPHYLGIPQHRERVYIMCIRKDVDAEQGTLPLFKFDESKIVPSTIESVLQDDTEIPNLEHYRLSEVQIQLIDLWDEFIKNIKESKLPGFPIWVNRLCDLDPDEDLAQYPDWKQNFIRKNNELYLRNKEFINEWLTRARKCPLFFGAKAKLEWQAGQYKNPSIWDNILQMRPSGIRVKPGTYFPALVAITQTSIVGPRQRFLTPRECARMQSFPDDKFMPDVNEAQAYKQFGNAVNVDMVKLFALYMMGDEYIRHTFSADNAEPEYSGVLAYIDRLTGNKRVVVSKKKAGTAKKVTIKGEKTKVKRLFVAKGNPFDPKAFAADALAAFVFSGDMDYERFLASKRKNILISEYVYDPIFNPLFLQKVPEIVKQALDQLENAGAKKIVMPLVDTEDGNELEDVQALFEAVKDWIETRAHDQIKKIIIADPTGEIINRGF